MNDITVYPTSVADPWDKKDGRQRRPLRFHVSRPFPPSRWIHYCTSGLEYGTSLAMKREILWLVWSWYHPQPVASCDIITQPMTREDKLNITLLFVVYITDNIYSLLKWWFCCIGFRSVNILLVLVSTMRRPLQQCQFTSEILTWHHFWLSLNKWRNSSPRRRRTLWCPLKGRPTSAFSSEWN